LPVPLLRKLAFLLIGAMVAVGPAAPSAQAVIIRGGDGTGNTGAPADDPGWANVGSLSGASAVYLTDGWVLTAYHVVVGLTGHVGNVTFGSTTYQPVADSFHRLTDPSTGLGVDLALFQLQQTPAGLSSLTISSSAPADNSKVLGIGYGRNRAESSTTWWVDTDTNPYTWRETWFSEADAVAQGFKWAAGTNKRWGENYIDASGFTIDDGFGITYALVMDFDASDPNYDAGDNELQVAAGDSGGALFSKNETSWELAGIWLARDTYTNQPFESAVYGNGSYAADLSVYRDQILSIVPEPSVIAMLAGLGAIGLGWYWRRRRQRRSL